MKARYVLDEIDVWINLIEITRLLDQLNWVVVAFYIWKKVDEIEILEQFPLISNQIWNMTGHVCILVS